MCGFLGHVLRACAQDLGLINVDLWVDSDGMECTQLRFNWKAVADLPWADAGVLPFCSFLIAPPCFSQFVFCRSLLAEACASARRQDEPVRGR